MAPRPYGAYEDENEHVVDMHRASLITQYQIDLSKHVASLDLRAAADAGNGNGSKDVIRDSHRAHRTQVVGRERKALEQHIPRLVGRFAEGSEIHPEGIMPEIVPVDSNGETGLLFRLATTLWSVPVSKGYGRRMRFLVIDANNDKLIGVLALGDPVFNLRRRDEWVGWNADQRRSRLSSVMDAYVVGAVPPYSGILGGKLVVSLIGSREISSRFDERYGKSRGIISGDHKGARLALVTVTSALGRSSIYNRVRLPGLVELVRVGTTIGWGHFHIPDSTFLQMRELLALDGHPYASGHAYGQGPNWRIRVIREAVKRIGLDDDFLRHGIRREIFAMPLAANFREYLLGQCDNCKLYRPSALDIGRACVDRWISPRARRTPDYGKWTRERTLQLIHSAMSGGNQPESPNEPGQRHADGNGSRMLSDAEPR